VHATVTGPEAALCPDGLKILRTEGPRIVFGPDGTATGLTPHEALKRIIERYDVADVGIEESDLEDVMRAAYLRQDDQDTEDTTEDAADTEGAPQGVQDAQDTVGGRV
jgi:ABC-2 type transport system ATP-binding protein